MAGGSAQLGEARVDIVADDASLSRGLARAEGKVRASARRMGQSVGRGISGGASSGQDGPSRYSLFGARGNDSFVRDVGRIRTAISTTLFAGAVAAGIATVIGRNIGGAEESLLKINAETTKERLKQANEEYDILSSQINGQTSGMADDGSTKGWIKDIIDAAYSRYFKIIEGNAEEKRAAIERQRDSLLKSDAEIQKRLRETEKRNRMYENMSRVEDSRQQMVQRFTEAVEGLERATQNLRQGFQLNDVGATISAIRDDIAIQTSSNAALYYNGGYVGGLASYFGRGR